MPVETRYQVFISSAFRDLVDERRAVVSALLELNCNPVGSDLYSIPAGEDWSPIRHLIEDCDYCLVVLGSNYRSLDLSALEAIEREYDFAVANGRPIMAFMRPEDRIEPDAEGGYTAHAARLQAFRDRLEAGTCRMWTTPYELGGAISRGCAQLIQSSPSQGWVRGGHAKTPDDYDRLAHLTEQVSVLEKELADRRAAELHTADNLAQGDDLVELEYSLRGEQAAFRIAASWSEVFVAVAMKAIELPTLREIETELSTWIAEHANSFDVVLTEDSLQKVMLQLFTLGLIETRWLQPGRVWGLTDRGRVLLGELRGLKSARVDESL